MYLKFKRFADIFVSLVAISVLSPLLLPIMIGLKLTGEGYIFYKQERVGFNNKLFFILKFATMLKNSPNMAGGIITAKNDPRITPMGGFLRKSKINELPQLINILLGDMSFVGPRPVMKKSFDQYPESVRSTIYLSRPGLTGVGSIVFRDEESLISSVSSKGEDPWEYYTQVIYPYKGRLEKWYYDNASFMVDLKILFLTVYVVIFPSSQLIFKFFPSIPKNDVLTNHHE